jgi:ABC-type polysaccharide/polyol phosphate transport system ATPase subunit
MNSFYEETEKMLIKLDQQVALIVSQMKLGGKLDPEDVFFDNQEFMLLMNISKRTAQEWRNKKIIEFSQVGNKIYYRLSDIQKLLNNNYNSK